jgi:hypothetical protein
MTTNQDQDKVNKFENFDAIYARELQMQHELQGEYEKVEVAYVKTVEKYGEYADLKAFAEYLCVIEKLFIGSKFRNQGMEESKDEMIKLRIQLVSKNSSLGEEVLYAIYRYFQKAGATIDRIYATGQELLEKHKQDAGYTEFILYIQDIFVNFLSAEQEHLNMDELKDRLIRARMEVLSSKGDPDLLTLQKIYKEFTDLLKN